MHSQKHLELLFLFFLLIPSVATACVVKYRSPDELKKEARLVLRVKILSKKVNNSSKLGELYSYTVKVESSERGRSLPTMAQVEYFNSRVHERNGLLACPLKNGSGLETDLTPGKSYRLFIDSLEKKEILFSELLA